MSQINFNCCLIYFNQCHLFHSSISIRLISNLHSFHKETDNFEMMFHPSWHQKHSLMIISNEFIQLFYCSKCIINQRLSSSASKKIVCVHSVFWIQRQACKKQAVKHFCHLSCKGASHLIKIAPKTLASFIRSKSSERLESLKRISLQDFQSLESEPA